MNRFKNREQAPLGFILVELLAVIAVLVLAAALVVGWVRWRRNERTCALNLHRIYSELEMYEIDHGALPRAAFFPQEIGQDSDSLVEILRPYGTEESIYVCPAAPPSYRALGLTYIWNARLNGKRMNSLDPSSWILTELGAMSGNTPAPHAGRYNTLRADGRVEALNDPPLGLSAP